MDIITKCRFYNDLTKKNVNDIDTTMEVNEIRSSKFLESVNMISELEGIFTMFIEPMYQYKAMEKELH
jgi:hypothetical protein